MTVRVTYYQAKANLSSLLDRASANKGIAIIERPGQEDVAVVSMTELRSLLELAHLMCSPANGLRLMAALERARRS